MNISKHTVASFHYTLRNGEGLELESSRGDQPTAYLHGASNIIPGLEAALEGKAPGDHVEVTLSAEEAYGQRREGAVQRVPVKHLIYRGKLRAGMTVQMNTQHGGIPVTVIKVGRHTAEVDTNHPLAGQNLSFEIDIVDVRAATSEEISHGHAHGAGGHQH